MREKDTKIKDKIKTEERRTEKSKCKLQIPGSRPTHNSKRPHTLNNHSHTHTHTHAYSCSGSGDLGSSADSALELLCDIAEDPSPSNPWDTPPPPSTIGEVKTVPGRPVHMGDRG